MKTLEARGVPNATRIQVLHFMEPAVDTWHYGARWLYGDQPATGVWYDVGQSLTIESHEEANTALGLPCVCNLTLPEVKRLHRGWVSRYFVCHFYYKRFNTSACPFVHTGAAKAARARGDSQSFCPHTRTHRATRPLRRRVRLAADRRPPDGHEQPELRGAAPQV